MSPLDYFRMLGYHVLNNVNNNVIHFASRDYGHRIQLINDYVTISVNIGETFCLKSHSFKWDSDLTSIINHMLEIKEREEKL